MYLKQHGVVFHEEAVFLSENAEAGN